MLGLVLMPSIGTMVLALGGAGIGAVDVYWNAIRWAQILVLAGIVISLTRNVRRWATHAEKRRVIEAEIARGEMARDGGSEMESGWRREGEQE